MKKRTFTIQVVDIKVKAASRFDAEKLVNAALTDLVERYALENGDNVCPHCGRACGGKAVCDICF